jgi:hypothetical protein
MVNFVVFSPGRWKNIIGNLINLCHTKRKPMKYCTYFYRPIKFTKKSINSQVISHIADIKDGEAYFKGDEMTITPYQVDSVLNAYTRQSKLKVSQKAGKENAPEGKYTDVVSLSNQEDNKAEEFDKISYNLRDVILKK